MKPVVIVGAGPAGLSCARALVAQGMPVVVIDDNRQPGGQYFRQLPAGYAAGTDARLLRETQRWPALQAVLALPLVRYLPETVAWTMPGPLVLAYAGPLGTGRIEAHAIVVASGAQDRPFPFTGWTLPGVMSAGGALNMAKGHGLVPDGQVVVAGNGPLVLVAAATLAAAGAKVSHVVEAARAPAMAAALWRGLWCAPSLLAKGLGYRIRLRAAGVRFVSGHTVVRAEGDSGVKAVHIAPLALDGLPDWERTQVLPATTLVVGYGLQPSSEFVRSLGCEMADEPLLGGAVPVRSGSLETSVQGVYAIGDGAGIGGVEMALLEGERAAAAILGRTPSWRTQLRHARFERFRRTLARAYLLPVPPDAAQDETVICRCERLQLGMLKACFQPGDQDLSRLKAATRLGMGRCQGRNCLGSAALRFGLPAAHAMPRTRAPVRPIRVCHIIADGDAGPAREPDENDVLLDQEPA